MSKKDTELVFDDHELPIEFKDYRPTPQEQRLLVVLSNPEARVMTIQDICRQANIHRDTYYKAFKKQGFVELSIRLAFELIKQEALPLVQTAIAAAKLGSFPHWKALMEMGGLYSDKKPNEGEEQTITIRFADPRARKDVTPEE